MFITKGITFSTSVSSNLALPTFISIRPIGEKRERINAEEQGKVTESDDYVLDLAATVILKFSVLTESTRRSGYLRSM